MACGLARRRPCPQLRGKAFPSPAPGDAVLICKAPGHKAGNFRPQSRREISNHDTTQPGACLDSKAEKCYAPRLSAELFLGSRMAWGQCAFRRRPRFSLSADEQRKEEIIRWLNFAQSAALRWRTGCNSVPAAARPSVSPPRLKLPRRSPFLPRRFPDRAPKRAARS